MATEQEIRALVREMQALYDVPMYGVLLRMWGENIHLGLYESPDDDLHTANQRENERMAQGAAFQPGQEVLEVGCGVGGAARYIARSFDVRVVATNISEQQLDIARQKIAEAGLSDRINFGYADFHDLPYADGRYDCRWCQGPLLHALDKLRVLREAWRVLRSSGRLVLVDLTAGDREMAPDAWVEFLEAAHAPSLWRMADYDLALPDAGFEVVEREDWSDSGALGWQKAHEETEKFRSEFEPEVGKEPVDATSHRYRMWAEATRAGYVGMCYYAARKVAG